MPHPDRIPSSTLVLCIPAEGAALDSTLIWPQSHIPVEFKAFPVQHIRVYCSKSSYQTRTSFTQMMLQDYLPEMIRRRELLQEKSPILLILDGHTSRLSVDVIRFCKQFNIILLILPSHTSHITQPLDCSPNGSLKNSFAIHASKTMNHTCIDIRDVQKMEQSQMIQKGDQKGDEDDDISEVGDDEAMEEKVPPLPDAFFSALGRNDYSQTSACQRRLLVAALPYALEKATSYDSVRSGWKKSGYILLTLH